jgi:hypothetical protein
MWVVALIVITLLAGCATPPTAYRSLDGRSDEARARVLANCKVKAAMVPDEGWAGAAMAESVRDNCMRAEGFVRVE